MGATLGSMTPNSIIVGTNHHALIINVMVEMCHVLNMLAHLVEDIVAAEAVVVQDMVAARANIIHLVKG